MQFLLLSLQIIKPKKMYFVQQNETYYFNLKLNVLTIIIIWIFSFPLLI